MKISQTPTPAASPHRVAPAVPVVEVADHRDARGVRRPDGEMHARDAGMLDRMRAQPLPQPAMRALADQIVVELAQHRAEAVGVVHLPRAAGIVGAQRVAEPDRPVLEHALEQAGLVAGFQLADDGAGRLPRPPRAGSAPGTSARITTPPGTSCGPSTANGSSCRASTSARTVASVRRLFAALAIPVLPARLTVALAKSARPINPSYPCNRPQPRFTLIHCALSGSNLNSFCITMRQV